GAGDDRPGVAHGLARWRGEPGDVADHRLGHVLPDELRRPLLRVPADLADHHDHIGVRISLERRQRVDVGGADHRVPADPHAGGEAEVAQLVHELVGEGAGLAHQHDAAGAGDVGGDDAGVDLPGGCYAGPYGVNDPGPAAGCVAGDEAGGVVHRDAFGDDHH